MEKLERVQRFAVKKILYANIHTPNAVVEGDTGLGSIKARARLAKVFLACRIKKRQQRGSGRCLYYTPLASVPRAAWKKLPS